MINKRIFEKTLTLHNTPSNKRHTSVWIMRQAGRYLPEYLEVRKQAGSFLDLCYTPKLASEVTLQPLRRFDLDAAIIFSDILVIPHGLGMNVDYIKGIGPVLENIKNINDIEKYATQVPNVADNLDKVYEAITLTRNNLDKNKSLIGFCGAPWTVAMYMMENHPSKNNLEIRKLAYSEPVAFEKLINLLVESSVNYLCRQIEAGVNVVKIFDSWASLVPHDLFEIAVKKPLLKISKLVKAKYPDVPIILFPRGISHERLIDFANNANGKFNALALDYTADIIAASHDLQGKVAIQGNLDPAVLLSNSKIIEQKTKDILDITTNKPGFIFNLGHGITPHTPIENVEIMIQTIRNYNR